MPTPVTLTDKDALGEFALMGHKVWYILPYSDPMRQVSGESRKRYATIRRITDATHADLTVHPHWHDDDPSWDGSMTLHGEADTFVIKNVELSETLLVPGKFTWIEQPIRP